VSLACERSGLAGKERRLGRDALHSLPRRIGQGEGTIGSTLLVQPGQGRERKLGQPRPPCSVWTEKKEKLSGKGNGRVNVRRTRRKHRAGGAMRSFVFVYSGPPGRRGEHEERGG